MNKYSDEYLWEICKEIYRQMYKEAKPSADFNKLMDGGEAKEEQFFMRYFLEDKRQQDIIDEICEKHQIKDYRKRKIETTVHLGCSPNTCERTWKEFNEKLNK